MKPVDSAASVRRGRGRPPKRKRNETPQVLVTAPAPVVEVAAEPVAALAPPPAEVASIAAPEVVMLGHIEGVGRHMALDDVMGLLGQPALDRIAVLRNSPAISDLSKRMIDTDGRCAPAYLTGESFFHGFEVLAAAIEAGMSSVFVVTVLPDDALPLQQYLVERQRASSEA